MFDPSTNFDSDSGHSRGALASSEQGPVLSESAVSIPRESNATEPRIFLGGTPLSNIHQTIIDQLPSSIHISYMSRTCDQIIIFLENYDPRKKFAIAQEERIKQLFSSDDSNFRVSVFSLTIDGEVTPVQLQQIRSLHLAAPHWDFLSTKDNLIGLGEPKSEKTLSETQICGELKRILRHTFDYTTATNDIKQRLVQSNEPVVSPAERKLANQLWPASSNADQKLSMTNYIEIDFSSHHIRIVQEARKLEETNLLKSQKKLTSLFPGQEMSIELVRGTSYADADRYIQTIVPPSVIRHSVHHRDGSILLSLLLKKENPADSEKVVREVRQKLTEATHCTVKVVPITKKTPYCEDIFCSFPPAWGLCKIITSANHKSALLLSALGHRTSPGDHHLTQLGQHFPEGLFFEATHQRKIQPSDPLYATTMERLPTRCELQSVQQCRVTGTITIEVLNAPEPAILRVLKDETTHNIAVKLIPTKIPPAVVAPAIKWLAEHAQAIPVYRDSSQNAVSFEGRGGCRVIGGSCLNLNLYGHKLILDCGTWLQSRQQIDFSHDMLNGTSFGILSHFHTDHAGGLIRAVEEGFHAPLLMTKATAVCMYPILLEQASRQGLARGWIEDLYKQICIVPFDIPVRLSESSSVTFLQAGHLLGSAMCLFRGERAGESHSVLYTGDYRNGVSRLHTRALPPTPVDILIAEGTYGMKEMRPRNQVEHELKEKIRETVLAGGAVVCPLLAFGRAQELQAILSDDKEFYAENDTPVHIVGGINEKNTIYEYFAQQQPELFNHQFLRQRPWRGIREAPYSRSSADKQVELICNSGGGKIILVAGGMVAGRAELLINHYCKEEKNLLLFSCFQVERTLGRRILDFTEGKIDSIRQFPDFRMQVMQTQLSGHSSGSESLEFISQAVKPNGKIILVHGEQEQLSSLEAALSERRYAQTVLVPEIGEEITL